MFTIAMVLTSAYVLMSWSCTWGGTCPHPQGGSQPDEKQLCREELGCPAGQQTVHEPAACPCGQEGQWYPGVH